MPDPILHPERARAVITTKWANGYKPVVVKNIEAFMIDTNIDQDADSFEMSIGDPFNHLAALKSRDGEIRIQIFGIGLNTDYLLTGLVDEVEVSESGVVTLSGRDRSSIATDTQAVAGKWNDRRANDFIEERARKLNIASSYSLANGPMKKTIRQDGSETEWEFWYRLIRREQMYLWFTPDGRLVSSKLGAEAPPSYFFGTPPSNVSASEAKRWVPVESVSYRKTTQTRIGNVQVFYKGQDNKNYATDFIPDKTIIADWEKLPLKYVEDTHVSTKAGANRTAYEEIYESKVGALEIQITVPDLGFIIRTNRTARLRIPEIDLGDTWFIVGTQIVAGPDGFVQQVRLREKNYAMTKRIPEEPKTEPAPGEKGAEETAECLEISKIACRPEWTGFLEAAANRYHSNVPYDLYLAILMAIMEKEGCRNVRQSGDIEWFKWTGKPQHGITSFAEYKDTFANDAGQSGGGVGPMQLTTQSFKVHADLLFGGEESELDGNRWMPEANIMTGAWVLTGKGGGALSEATVWAAVKAYNGSGADAEAYMQDIKKKVFSSGGYLDAVQEAIAACKEAGTIGDADDDKNGIVIPTRHITDHCTGNRESYYAWDFMGSALQNVYMDEPAKSDPSYGQSPHLQSWRDGVGGWTFQIIGDSGTQYWITHLDENDPKRYTGGKIGAGGYIGRLTDSAFKAKLINGAHVHVGSPQWPYPGKDKRGC